MSPWSLPVHISDYLRQCKSGGQKVVPAMRKTLFSLSFWWPLFQWDVRTKTPLGNLTIWWLSQGRAATQDMEYQEHQQQSNIRRRWHHQSRPYLFVAIETWHRSSSDTPPVFNILDTPCCDSMLQSTRGLAIFHLASLQVRELSFNTFEVLPSSFSTTCGPLTIAAIYQWGSQPPLLSFIQEFTLLLEHLATFIYQLVVTGDLTVHTEDPNCPWTIQLMQLLSSFGLCQHVKESTHTHGDCLDLVIITHDDCTSITVTMEAPSISNHTFVISLRTYRFLPASMYIIW